MDLQLKDRTALVTGASGGIGRAIAAALAREGVRLSLVARRADRLAEVAQELADSGAVRPEVIVQDVFEPGAPKRIAGLALEQLSTVDILINNAGGHWPATSDAPSETWLEAFTLNLFRHRELTQELEPGMVKRQWGRVINITGKSEPERVSGVSCAKAAMHAWAKGLSREVAPYGITVNCIAPGRITTEQMLRDYTPEVRARHTSEIPMGRYGDPGDIAAVACFLASPLADYVTGIIVPVDGGLRRYQF